MKKKGTNSVCESLANKLEEQGHVISRASDKTSRLARLWDYATAIILGHKRYDLAQIDVFSDRPFIGAEFSAFLLRLVKKPYILTIHGGDFPRFSRQHPQRVRRVIKPAKAVTVPSNYLFTQLAHLNTSLTCLPNPIDLNRFTFKQRPQPTAKILWIRAFENHYNPCMAIHMLKQLKKSIPSATLTMVGPIRDQSIVKVNELVKKYGLADDIDFPGPAAAEDVPDILNQHDIFINTTHIDNTPLCIMEAIASGLNVVSTNVQGIPFLVTDEKHALLVPDNDHCAMAEKIQTLIEHPETAQEIQIAAYQLVKSFDWKTILAKWISLSDHALQKNPS